MITKRTLDGVVIKTNGPYHCAGSCPLFIANEGTCVLLRGTRWCLRYDPDRIRKVLGKYRRCGKCRRLERRSWPGAPRKL